MAKKAADKASKIDELAELVLEDKVVSVLLVKLTALLTPVMEAIAKQMAVDITKEVTKEVSKEVTSALNKTMGEHYQAMESMCNENFEKCNTQLTGMDDKLKQMEENNRTLAGKLEDMERHSKLSNLIIHGISPASRSPLNDEYGSQRTQRETDRSIVSDVLHLFQTRLGLDITERDISTVHRLHASTDNSMLGPIIVSFTSRRTRNEVFNARKLLRSTTQSGHPREKIYINEHLTKFSAHLYASVRKLVKEKVVASTWTYGGFVFAKKTTDPNATLFKISSTVDIEKLSSLI